MAWVLWRSVSGLKVLWQYLNQPLFDPDAQLILNPWQFWHHYNVYQLERCWNRDYVAILERCWMYSCAPEESL